MNRTECMVYSYVVSAKKIVRVRVRATETREARPVDQEARLYRMSSYVDVPYTSSQYTVSNNRRSRISRLPNGYSCTSAFFHLFSFGVLKLHTDYSKLTNLDIDRRYRLVLVVTLMPFAN
jgi:hypothetical protein